MKIIGIRKANGEYNGRPYETYWLTVQLQNNDAAYGINTKQINFNKRNFDTFAVNHKIQDYSKLVGYEYSMEYYDAYRKLVDLV